MLRQLQVVLKENGLSVREQFEGQHPILIVQKDQTESVPYDVDISFDGHLAVHKSHKVGLLLTEHPGARSLARLVKEWARQTKIKGPVYLSSHAWMLLVIRYMSVGGERSDLGFFEWFVQSYPSDRPWSLGNGQRPFEFEAENVAQSVQLKGKDEISKKVELATVNLQEGRVPWLGLAPAPAVAPQGGSFKSFGAALR
jgi:hypothetical protein